MDEQITLSIKRDSNINPSDRIIVIDPGHGGSQPGAVQNNVYEKDVNLSISLKLNEVLQEKGYTTIMTRYEDSTLGYMIGQILQIKLKQIYLLVFTLIPIIIVV